MRRRLEVEYMSPSCAEFTGWGARELHVEITGKPPVWNTRTRRWVTSPLRMADIIVLAETRGGYEVVEAGLRYARSLSVERIRTRSTPPAGAEAQHPDRGLW